MKKQAYEIVEPSSHVGKGLSLLADSVGRVKGLPMALFLGQEKAHHHLQSFTKDELEAEIAHLKKDPRLQGTLIRLNHSDPVDTIKRLIKNKNVSAFNKTLGTLAAFPNAYITAATRMNHYNPTTDTVELYSKMPEIAHHELGHARDMKGSPATGLAHSIENLALPSLGFSGAGPISQYAETRANEEAEKGYKGDIKEFRRRLWPGRGTYWSSALAATALLHPDIRDAAVNFINDGSGGISKALKTSLLLSTVPAAGAIGGRLAAEARNLFDKPREKKAHIINAIGRRLFGKSYIPRPENNESVRDSIENNRRMIDAEHSALNHIGGIALGNPLKSSVDIQEAMKDPGFMRSFGRTIGSAGEGDAIVSALRNNLTKNALERLKGGKGDNKYDSSFNKKELAKGVAHEGEHTKVKAVAKEIAKDHLSERKDYYTALDKSGLE